MTEQAQFVKSESDDRTANNGARHAYRVLNEQEKASMVEIKDAGEGFLALIEKVASEGANSRELSLARTKVEEAVMWAVKHITK